MKREGLWSNLAEATIDADAELLQRLGREQDAARAAFEGAEAATQRTLDEAQARDKGRVS